MGETCRGESWDLPPPIPTQDQVALGVFLSKEPGEPKLFNQLTEFLERNWRAVQSEGPVSGLPVT